MSRHQDPAPSPDARLDPYRRGAALVSDGDRYVANLVTRVQVWWAVEGRRWRRQLIQQVERVEWFLTFEPGYEGSHPDGLDDGVDADPVELDEEAFTYVGRTLSLTWLSGEQADVHVATYDCW